MRSNKGRPITLLLASLTAVMLASSFPSTSHADDPDDGIYTPDPNAPRSSATTSVTSEPDGVVIRIAVTQSSQGAPGGQPVSTDGGSSSGAGWTCDADPMSIGNATRAWFEDEAPNHPDSTPWVVSCTNGYFDVVWLPNTATDSSVSVVVVQGDPVDPLLVAADILENVPVPDISIGVNPAPGLVALPSWFWIEGYDGSPIVESVALAGVTVDVEITPTTYAWTFGDGAELQTASIGRPYPQQSEIRHIYEQSSLVAGGAYTLTVEITFAVRYRVDGGAWEVLEPISRSFAADYPVQQLQSILTGS